MNRPRGRMAVIAADEAEAVRHTLEDEYRLSEFPPRLPPAGQRRTLKELAHNGLAGRGHVRRLSLAFEAAPGGPLPAHSEAWLRNSLIVAEGK